MQNNKPFLIKIKNFQSLSEANLELPDGLTIVTGTTNNGKSAIVRAVEAAVFNDGVDEYIKAGTDELSVMLDNGEHKVEYIRKSKGRTDKTNVLLTFAKQDICLPVRYFVEYVTAVITEIVNFQIKAILHKPQRLLTVVAIVPIGLTKEFVIIKKLIATS